jgi:hypothetical protein
MTSLASYVLSLALSTFAPGSKIHSLERLPACGGSKTNPTCPVEPVCEQASILCAPPRWDDKIGAWVRVESREAGARRLEVVAQALADAAHHQGAAWHAGPQDLARAMLAAGGWSTGLREDIQVGRTRGPAGEVCLMDLQIPTLRALVPYDLSRLPAEELAQKVVGLEYPELRRCFDAGALLLVRARREAERRCKGTPMDYATFAIYATGSECNTRRGAKGDWLAGPRLASLLKWRQRKATIFPDWYRSKVDGRSSSMFLGSDEERMSLAD